MLRGKTPASQEMAEQIKQQPLESAEQMIGQAGVTEGLGEFVGPLTRGLKGTSEAIRRTAQSAVGAGKGHHPAVEKGGICKMLPKTAGEQAWPHQKRTAAETRWTRRTQEVDAAVAAQAGHQRGG